METTQPDAIGAPGRLDDAAIAEDIDPDGVLLPVEPVAHEGFGVEGSLHAAGKALLEDIGKGRPGTRQLVRDVVHLGVAPVADHQLLVGIEHAQPVRHVAQRHVEQEILPAQLFLALLQVVALTPQFVAAPASAPCR